ncbi:MAG: ABC transporter permease [Candidatus Xenobia bacterium]
MNRLWTYREVMWALVVRDIKVRYKQTALGVLWAVLQPLSQAVVFSLVFASMSGQNPEGLPYFLFVYVAVIPWTLLATSLNVGGACVVAHASLLTKVDFPREVIPLAAVLANVLDYGMGLLILVIMLPWFNYSFHVSLLLVPAILALELIFASALAMLLSAATVFYRDVRYLVPLLTLLWLFLTPVFYPLTRLGGVAARILPWNPVAWIVELHRAALTSNFHGAAEMFVRLAVSSILLFAVAYATFKRWEPAFADVI